MVKTVILLAKDIPETIRSTLNTLIYIVYEAHKVLFSYYWYSDSDYWYSDFEIRPLCMDI